MCFLPVIVCYDYFQLYHSGGFAFLGIVNSVLLVFTDFFKNFKNQKNYRYIRSVFFAYIFSEQFFKATPLSLYPHPGHIILPSIFIFSSNILINFKFYLSKLKKRLIFASFPSPFFMERVTLKIDRFISRSVLYLQLFVLAVSALWSDTSILNKPNTKILSLNNLVDILGKKGSFITFIHKFTALMRSKAFNATNNNR